MTVTGETPGGDDGRYDELAAVEQAALVQEVAETGAWHRLGLMTSRFVDAVGVRAPAISPDTTLSDVVHRRRHTPLDPWQGNQKGYLG
jgi:hypothetical protein